MYQRVKIWGEIPKVAVFSRLNETVSGVWNPIYVAGYRQEYFLDAFGQAVVTPEFDFPWSQEAHDGLNTEAFQHREISISQAWQLS